MSFIRAKEIPPHSGNWYDYEVMTIHEGDKVIQKHIRYIGKCAGPHGGSGGGAGRTPSAGPKLVEPPQPKVACKFCGSQHTRKYGLTKGVQAYFCNDCRTRFIGTDALPHGRVSPSYIANALQEYYSGMSFRQIEDNIEQQTGEAISHTAVVKWINKYTAEAIRQTRDLHPNVGDTWIADETYIQTDIKTTDPKGVVFWDIIDAKTRFLLATRITTTRGTQDARQLMELAAKRAGKTPKVVVTDKLAAYIDGIEQAYGADTRHRRGGPFKAKTSGENTALIERFHNTLKDRTKVMRDLRDKHTLKRFTDGWLVYYNFYRPDMALNEQAPAEVASLKYNCHSWADLVGYEKEPLVQTLEPQPVGAVKGESA
jgi:putative transposase